jgi:hypothetical protein
MPCLVILLAVLMPRVTMVLIAIFTSWFSQAFESLLWPIVGFIFLPYTTLAYMAAMLNNDHQVSGIWLVVIIIAEFVDLGSHGSAASRRRRT